MKWTPITQFSRFLVVNKRANEKQQKRTNKIPEQNSFRHFGGTFYGRNSIVCLEKFLLKCLNEIQILHQFYSIDQIQTTFKLIWHTKYGSQLFNCQQKQKQKSFWVMLLFCSCCYYCYYHHHHHILLGVFTSEV